MRIQIEAPFQVSEPMQNLITEKAEKFKTIFDRILAVEVYLKDEIQRNHHKENRLAQIKLSIPGQTIFAESESATYEKAIQAAADKAKRQLRKFKTQLVDHR